MEQMTHVNFKMVENSFDRVLQNCCFYPTLDKILNSVWKYSKDADTHTVETHIYRLRKKMKDKFNEQNFIINKKDGYII